MYKSKDIKRADQYLYQAGYYNEMKQWREIQEKSLSLYEATHP